MKKQNLIILFAILMIFTCCHNEPQVSDTMSLPKMNQEDLKAGLTTSIYSAQEERAQFEEAIHVFEEGDFTTAANYLDTSVQDLRHQDKYLNKEARLSVNPRMKEVDLLARQLRNDDVRYLVSLQDAFLIAEMKLAYCYLIASVAGSSKYPDVTNINLQKAISKLEHVVLFSEGTSKLEVNDLLNEAKQFLFKSNKTRSGEAYKLSLDIEKWIEKNS